MLKSSDRALDLQSRAGAALAILPISPNGWTLLSVLIASSAAISIAGGQLLAGLILFIISALCDAADGAVARSRGQSTSFGAFLDGVSDRLVEAMLLISLMFLPLPQVLIDARIWIASLLFLGTCMPSYIRAYAHHKGLLDQKSAALPSGILERGERVGLISLGIALGALVSLDLLVHCIILASALSLVTSVQRFLAALSD